MRFTEPGTHTVSLYVMDDKGKKSAPYSQTITVTAPTTQ